MSVAQRYNFCPGSRSGSRSRGHASYNKDKCVQEPRPKGFVGEKNKKKKTTTSDISSRALIKPIARPVIMYLHIYDIYSVFTK